MSLTISNKLPQWSAEPADTESKDLKVFFDQGPSAKVVWIKIYKNFH